MGVTELGPLPKCGSGKRGAHHLFVVTPEDSDGDMTLFCDACGMVRRMPAKGALYVGSLDGKSAAEIRRAVSG